MAKKRKQRQRAAKKTAPPKSQVQPNTAANTVEPLFRGPPEQTLLNRKEMLARVGFSYPAVWTWMREGRFPRARVVGRNRSAWLESEIIEWIATRPVRKLKGDEVA